MFTITIIDNTTDRNAAINISVDEDGAGVVTLTGGVENCMYDFGLLGGKHNTGDDPVAFICRDAASLLWGGVREHGIYHAYPIHLQMDAGGLMVRCATLIDECVAVGEHAKYVIHSGQRIRRED